MLSFYFPDVFLATRWLTYVASQSIVNIGALIIGEHINHQRTCSLHHEPSQRFEDSLDQTPS